jgi:hypothetical protein
MPPRVLSCRSLVFRARRTEMKDAARYIEEHHEDWGVALFIVPVLLAAWAMMGVASLAAWVLH